MTATETNCWNALSWADKRDKLGRELSKGMQQKLSICCGLVHRPKLLIFDEPMIGLDPHAIKELKLLFQEQKARAMPCSSPPT